MSEHFVSIRLNENRPTLLFPKNRHSHTPGHIELPSEAGAISHGSLGRKR